ncbi:MAG: adenosylcobalamin-dependent ribonucleoside-diphosphate reductase, partial [Dehalococcoidia bacterium]
DSIEEIFEAAKYTAVIHKSGGGTGFAFSNLRPESDRVGSTGGIASGPVSFIRIFDTATDVVKQGGTRRGANMGILDVRHPDILKFIHAKDDDTSLQNFNISVAVTEEFMQAVERGDDYDLINPRTQHSVDSLNAAEVFQEMVESAWKTGDPGIIFIDRMNDNYSNPVPKRGPIQATNPCGEQPLYSYDSCNLGSINLAKFVVDRSVRTSRLRDSDLSEDSALAEEDDPAIDWDGLNKAVRLCVHFLDNVVDMNRYPIAQIEETSKSIRRIGLGVMGWADMLILLGIPYDSDRALKLGEQVMEFLNTAAADASEELTGTRGNFPDWEDSVYGPKGALGERPMRNSTRTTIAPTGTISIIANCSSGIEPLFALSYVRHVMDNARLVEVNPYFEAVARREGFYSPELMEKLAEKGSGRGMKEVPEWVQELFVTSHDIDPEWHVRMQAAFQRHTDNAVSKTVNFSNDATVEDVRKVYMLAYNEGCKGVTIYRDGSKSQQVLNTGQTGKARGSTASHPSSWEGPPVPRKRPSTVQGVTEKVHTGHGNMYVTINVDEEGRPFEVFTNLGKAGGCDSAQLEAISRLASLVLRSGIEPEEVVDQLRGITCCPTWNGGGEMVRSGPDAVALALSRHIKDEESVAPVAAGGVASQPSLFE